MLHHKPGQSMGKSDALSRQADHGSGQGDDNNLTLLSPENALTLTLHQGMDIK
jgi:hypothetical protein